MKALIIVDIQNDFLPGGSLAVVNGDKVIPVINELLNKKWDAIVASKDWHPPDHGSFAETHGKKIGDIIKLDDIDQILWPKHCVQNTHGSEFGPGLDTSKIEKIFFKGIDKNIDSYSTFYDNEHQRSTGLNEYLESKEITDVYITGLTTDYCVKYSTLDAIKLGYNVFIIKEGCRPVELKKGDEKKALDEMHDAGAEIISINKL